MTIRLNQGKARQTLRHGGLARRGMQVARYLPVCAGVCWLLLGTARDAWSQSENSSEYAVKLAFLYNFTKFIEWPPEAFRVADTPFEICVAGRNPFSGGLEQTLRGRTVSSHPVVLRNFQPGQDLTGCDIVFISGETKTQAESTLARLRGSSTLTVGETPGFAANGGVINFVVEDGKVRFEINVGAAKLNSLTISSKLLALASIVKD